CDCPDLPPRCAPQISPCLCLAADRHRISGSALRPEIPARHRQTYSAADRIHLDRDKSSAKSRAAETPPKKYFQCSSETCVFHCPRPKTPVARPWLTPPGLENIYRR